MICPPSKAIWPKSLPCSLPTVFSIVSNNSTVCGSSSEDYYTNYTDAEYYVWSILPEIAGRCELQTVRFALYNDTFDLQDETTLNTYEELAALDLTGASKVLEITDSLTYVVFQFDEGQKGIAQVNRKTVSASDLTIVGVGFTGRLQR